MHLYSHTCLLSYQEFHGRVVEFHDHDNLERQAASIHKKSGNVSQYLQVCIIYTFACYLLESLHSGSTWVLLRVGGYVKQQVHIFTVKSQGPSYLLMISKHLQTVDCLLVNQGI